MARKNSILSVSLADDGTLTFNVEGAGSFDLNPANLSNDIISHATRHGLVQKVSDAAAIAKADLPTDPVEAAKAKFNAMAAVRDRLVEGEWSKRSGDGSGPVAGIIYRAFEEWVGVMAKKAKKPAPEAAAIRAKYDAMTRAEQLALRNIPDLAKIMERIRAERGPTTSTIDADSLLETLGL